MKYLIMVSFTMSCGCLIDEARRRRRKKAVYCLRPNIWQVNTQSCHELSEEKGRHDYGITI